MAEITVALMTRNRPHFLRQAMQSVLAQQDVELELLVFDNASTDDTPDVVLSFGDPRVSHLPSDSDIGIMRNWNRAIDTAKVRSAFVSIFHDDDIMLPGFLAESLRALRDHRSAGICLSLTEFIDGDGNVTEILQPGAMTPGLNRSLDMVELIMQGRAPLIFPPMGVFRAETLQRIGPADSPHTRATCDMSHWHRAIMDSDVCFLPKVLTQYRLHGGTDTHLLHQKAKALGWYGVLVERGDLIAHLLRSERAADPQYRKWLADWLVWTHAAQSDSLHTLSDEIYHTPENRMALLASWLDHAIPPGQPVILIDDAQLGAGETINGRRIVPFIERDGQYWGHPESAQHAIGELERLRCDGIHWLAVAWPCRWWLHEYGDFEHHLRSHYRIALNFPHGVIFDLRNDRGESNPA